MWIPISKDMNTDFYGNSKCICNTLPLETASNNRYFDLSFLYDCQFLIILLFWFLIARFLSSPSDGFFPWLRVVEILSHWRLHPLRVESWSISSMISDPTIHISHSQFLFLILKYLIDFYFFMKGRIIEFKDANRAISFWINVSSKLLLC